MQLEQKSLNAFLEAVKKLDGGFAGLPEFSPSAYDENRLRDVLKATAERLTLHKNTVQYRVRRAEESLARPVDQDRLRVELALLAAQWLGPAVLRPAGRAP